VLFLGASVVDAIGQVGFDPGSEWGTDSTSTADNTLRREDDACTADTDTTDAFDPAVNYTGYPQDTYDGLGSPGNLDCGGGGCSLSFVGDVTATVNGAGTSVSFAGRVANAGPGTKSVRLRVSYNRNGGPPTGTLTYGPVNLAQTGGNGVPFKVNQPIPGAAPPGTYNLTFELIDAASGTVCATDNATIVLSAPATGGGTEWIAAPLTFEASAGASASGAGVTAYPNPTAGTAVLRYTLAEGSDVRLVVYDALGREVAVLVDGRVEAGVHEAVLDARALPAGVYVYRLTAGAQVQAGRLTLVR
jgi:hypothetical protein